ncbi:MAG TPA: 4-hydroxy-3-methylbut-2-enyl diphosphate reductase [Candidatus Hydrogenedentes bacterium]|nr:4-hydroxy-3-methylbut-2-enyl diphosphate reductase [Candidatus Hydrogenedentota bacterium]HRZ16733.1 4-hydroxy-3-methylbut-2-enyl diphosphate reductase [Candidatus Hydrogenedentota bacterium]
MKIVVARPRGFCAGVDRAIRSVEQALERHGAPVHVLNHIVHNAHVVEELRGKGAVFVRDLDEVPEGGLVLFSAHGVGPDRWAHAKRRGLNVIDATCPLVEKVHNEARRFSDKGRTVILVGEAGHDETLGTMGWAPDHILLVQTLEEAEHVAVPDPANTAYITQTTLSVEDCRAIVEVLKRRFPEIQAPPREDICYATSNRQAAVVALSPEADLVLVVGDAESANSKRLRDIARGMGKPAHLIPDAGAIRPEWLDGVTNLLLTSGASVPERLVAEVIEYARALGPCEVEERTLVEEDVEFRLPKELLK